MHRFIRQFVLSLAALAAFGTHAQGVPRSDAQDPNYQRPAKGWFFFEDKPKPKEPEASASEPAPDESPASQARDACKQKSTWTPSCGFVNPGQDFEFQAKQRDALLERMVVSENDPKAVEAFQRYMRWALERTSEVVNMWQYNMAQNPELDPTVRAPISTLGLRLMTEVQKGKTEEISKLLKEEGAVLVYFSKHDCQFCHSMAPLVSDLGRSLQVPVRNAALDDKCIAELAEGCKTNVTTPAQILQVSVVPTVFLYLPKNTWIRIATGLTDSATMKERAMQFFLAYRTALLRGVQNGQEGKASVDFSGNDDFMTGATKGVEPAAPRLPTQGEIEQLLGKQ